jgi:enamine deaminase RidA (YjgF/YER057c/UK114 family)
MKEITEKRSKMSKEITRIGVGSRMSEAVIFNGVAYLAGQVGKPKGSVTEQTQDCLDEVDRILAAAGSAKNRILSAQIWMSDMSNFSEMNLVWDQWVPQGHAPARATGEAKLATADHLVEVIVTAAIG